MRNILLTTAALLWGTVALAQAQTAAPSQGQLAAPYGAGPASNNNNNAWGIANTPSGSTAAGPLSTQFPPNTLAVPTPGTIVIRLNGRVEVDLTGNFTSVDKGVTATGAPNGYKLNPLGIAAYARLYPGFDGLAANGLRYGATVEIRTNFSGGNANGATFASGAGGAASGPSTNSSEETLYVRRAFTYLATDQTGIVRLGQGDGVLGLFDNCIFTSQCWDAGEGVFDGGGSTQTEPTNVIPPWVWLSGSGAEYANNKIVYLSPQIYGFDFGVQYAPNEGNSFQNTGNGVGCGQAGPSCVNVTSGNDATRWINQAGLGLRFQHNFGAVDVKTYGFYEVSGKENLTTTGTVSPAAALKAAIAGTNETQFQRYDNLGFYKAGVAVTAANITLAADYIGGRINGALNLAPTGGAPMNAVITGLTYAHGPITAGAEIGIIDSQGDTRLVDVSQRHEYEVAFGGAYKLAPGVQLVGEYQYTHRHQGGFDFATGTVDTSLRTVDAQSQGVTFATVLTW